VISFPTSGNGTGGEGEGWETQSTPSPVFPPNPHVPEGLVLTERARGGISQRGREGATADVRWGCGKVPVAALLDQPEAKPVPTGHRSEGLVGPGDASPRQHGDAPWSDGDGRGQGCCGIPGSVVPVSQRRWRGGDSSVGRCHGGQTGLQEGGRRGAVPGCWGRTQMARGGMLSRCYQSVAALPSAAASPGCKSDLNRAEDFSARSGLAVGIRSGDSGATGRPGVPAGAAKGA